MRDFLSIDVESVLVDCDAFSMSQRNVRDILRVLAQSGAAADAGGHAAELQR